MTAPGTCSIVENGKRCELPVLVKSRGWCSKHYQRWHRTGDPLTVLITPHAEMPEHCLVNRCPGVVTGRGYCEAHYKRWRRGDPVDVLVIRAGRSVEERFWSKVDKDSDPGGCWLFTGALSRGYGQIGDGQGGVMLAHVWAWTQENGPVPDGLELDHVWTRGCRHRNCVRVAHLEAVTHLENMRRGAYARKTHCKRDHEFTPENTYIDKRGYRHCRACDRARNPRRRP